MKPFNLEAAMRGEPVVTRDGRPFVFGAYNPEAEPKARIVGWVDGRGYSTYEDGRVGWFNDTCDLFMAPKKRTVWVKLGLDGVARWFDSEEQALQSCFCDSPAWPLEIEE